MPMLALRETLMEVLEVGRAAKKYVALSIITKETFPPSVVASPSIDKLPSTKRMEYPAPLMASTRNLLMCPTELGTNANQVELGTNGGGFGAEEFSTVYTYPSTGRASEVLFV